VADAIETEVEHALQRAGLLRQAILERAFEGGLVSVAEMSESGSIMGGPAGAEVGVVMGSGLA